MEQVSLVQEKKDSGKEVSSVLETKNDLRTRQRTRCEVWSRVVGYLRPTSKWNDGKQEEFKDRALFCVE